MLLLTFRAADNLYAIDVVRVVEVVPRIQLRRLPHAQGYLAGVFDYRGRVVPVVDLGVLLGSESCHERLSTRIILVDSRPAIPPHQNPSAEVPETERHNEEAMSQDGWKPQSEEPRRWLLGLIAEHVSDVSSVKPEQMISASLELPQTPYLGAIVEIHHEMVQLIAVDKVLDASLQQSFFEAVPDDKEKSRVVEKAAAGPI